MDVKITNNDYGSYIRHMYIFAKNYNFYRQIRGEQLKYVGIFQLVSRTAWFWISILTFSGLEGVVCYCFFRLGSWFSILFAEFRTKLAQIWIYYYWTHYSLCPDEAFFFLNMRAFIWVFQKTFLRVLKKGSKIWNWKKRQICPGIENDLNVHRWRI